MNIFYVHSNVIGQYSNYISSFIEIADNTILTESNLVKVSFPIFIKLVLANDVEPCYKVLSSY